MVLRHVSTVPTKEDAIERDEDIQRIRREGAYMDVAEQELRSACADPRVPVDPADVEIIFAEFGSPCRMACASPYGCGEYKVIGQSEGPEWRVERKPAGYLIFISERKTEEFMNPHEEIRDTVRHELAHICGWEEECVTYEGRGNHAEWMERLGAN